MNRLELKKVLDKHRKWVLGEPDGEQADLSSADLSSADLSSADLSSADLRSADLRSANLSFADLRSANLSFADLSFADLSSANLSFADLSFADLSSANLSYANLSSVNLSSVNLSSADLHLIKEDFFKVLTVAKSEILPLYDALMKGNVDGSAYEGECACLVGTIANARHEKYNNLTIDLKPDLKRLSERWFLGIKNGDIPQSNSIAQVTSEWMREFMDKDNIKYPKYEITAIWG